MLGMVFLMNGSKSVEKVPEVQGPKVPTLSVGGSKCFCHIRVRCTTLRSKNEFQLRRLLPANGQRSTANVLCRREKRTLRFSQSDQVGKN
mgnify:CR=1 FL=1